MDYNACTQPQRPSRLIKGAAGVRFAYGLKAGINVSNFAFPFNPSPAERKQAVGYQAGLFLRLSNKSRFSLLLEASYTHLRSTYESANVPGSVFSTYVVSIDYTQLQVPLLVRYTLGRGPIRPFLNAGGMFAINLNNKSVVTERDFSLPIERDFSQPLTTPEDLGFGVTAGAGTTIRYASLPELSFELGYDSMRYGNYLLHNSIHFDVSTSF
ncbi:PorT family protein [Hymenobacter sp. BT664]|uniref:PorT family protein n=1 Tax=Hymenobacter montanus TaxID=2771359 RepID=A0A927BFL5_9BACT|nr:porin family protein [Hymenobacter montanus]MBD2769985.1 PorT family protein [Hymenobacter montanus]